MAEALYTIEAVTKRTIMDVAGRFKEVYEVSFVTASGVRDAVSIPLAEYTPDRVKERLTELAKVHEQIIKG